MTQEEKDLLLKDICSRLPYGVKLQHVKNTDSIVELYSIDLDDFYCKIQFYTYKGKALIASDEGKLLKPGGMLRYKPCLFPLESMTEEQCVELRKLIYGNLTLDDEFNEGISFKTDGDIDVWFNEKPINNCYFIFDWLNKNHFDYRGLIPMGLANNATGLNIYE